MTMVKYEKKFNDLIPYALISDSSPLMVHNFIRCLNKCFIGGVLLDTIIQLCVVFDVTQMSYQSSISVYQALKVNEGRINVYRAIKVNAGRISVYRALKVKEGKISFYQDYLVIEGR